MSFIWAAICQPLYWATIWSWSYFTDKNTEDQEIEIKNILGDNMPKVTKLVTGKARIQILGLPKSKAHVLSTLYTKEKLSGFLFLLEYWFSFSLERSKLQWIKWTELHFLLMYKSELVVQRDRHLLQKVTQRLGSFCLLLCHSLCCCPSCTTGGRFLYLHSNLWDGENRKWRKSTSFLRM